MIMEQIKLERASGSHLDSPSAPHLGVTYEFWSVELSLQYFTQNGGLKQCHVPQHFKIRRDLLGAAVSKQEEAHCSRGKQPARI